MAIKKKKRKKANTLAILLSVVLSLLLIIIVLALTNEPSSLLKAQTGPTCTDKSIVLKFGPVPGQEMKAPTARQAKALAFDVARIAMMIEWNGSEGDATVKEANQQLDCAVGQNHCKQKDASAYCRPQGLDPDDCQYSPIFHPATSELAAYYTNKAICTADVNCKKNCMPLADYPPPSPTPRVNKCNINEQACGSPAAIIGLTKTSTKYGEEVPATYPVTIDVMNEAKQSAIDQAKENMDCPVKEGESYRSSTDGGVTGFGCMIIPDDPNPTTSIIEGSIDCPENKVLLVKSPPYDEYVEFIASCTYQCKYTWQCQPAATPIVYPVCQPSGPLNDNRAGACKPRGQGFFKVENSATASTDLPLSVFGINRVIDMVKAEAIDKAIDGDGTASNTGLKGKCQALAEKTDPMWDCKAALDRDNILSTTKGCAVGCKPDGDSTLEPTPILIRLDNSGVPIENREDACKISSISKNPITMMATCGALCEYRQDCVPKTSPIIVPP